jgi:mgtE-like transporter
MEKDGKRLHSITAALRGWFREESRDLSESSLSLFLCTFGDLITGVIIGLSSGKILLLPALILLIPPTIGMRGNIYATLGSRMGSYLHTGRLSPELKRNKILDDNILSSTALTLLTSIYVGFIASALARFMGFQVDFVTLTLISVISAILSAFLLLPVTILLAIITYKKGLDPDNFTAPIITLAGDFITLPLLFITTDIVFSTPSSWQIPTFIGLIGLTILLLSISYMRDEEAISREILIESTPILLMTGLLGLWAGQILGGRLEGFITMVGLFTLIPPFLEDGGAIGGIVAARLSSKLHMGVLEIGRIPQVAVLRNFFTMHVLGIFIFSLLGVFAYVINFTFGLSTPGLITLVTITLVAGQIMILILNLVSYYSSVIAFKFGLDPDNVVIPIITSFMDVAGTACLVFVLLLFGVI